MRQGSRISWVGNPHPPALTRLHRPYPIRQDAIGSELRIQRPLSCRLLDGHKPEDRIPVDFPLLRLFFDQIASLRRSGSVIQRRFEPLADGAFDRRELIQVAQFNQRVRLIYRERDSAIAEKPADSLIA